MAFCDAQWVCYPPPHSQNAKGAAGVSRLLHCISGSQLLTDCVTVTACVSATDRVTTIGCVTKTKRISVTGCVNTTNSTTKTECITKTDRVTSEQCASPRCKARSAGSATISNRIRPPLKG